MSFYHLHVLDIYMLKTPEKLSAVTVTHLSKGVFKF